MWTSPHSLPTNMYRLGSYNIQERRRGVHSEMVECDMALGESKVTRTMVAWCRMLCLVTRALQHNWLMDAHREGWPRVSYVKCVAGRRSPGDLLKTDSLVGGVTLGVYCALSKSGSPTSPSSTLKGTLVTPDFCTLSYSSSPMLLFCSVLWCPPSCSIPVSLSAFVAVCSPNIVASVPWGDPQLTSAELNYFPWGYGYRNEEHPLLWRCHSITSSQL